MRLGHIHRPIAAGQRELAALGIGLGAARVVLALALLGRIGLLALVVALAKVV